MKKFAFKLTGGVLILTILLSLTFTACSDGGNPNENGGDDASISNPSPTLPENQWTNPVDEILGEDSNETSIKLNEEWLYILLKNNGVATAYSDIYEDTHPPLFEFKYTHNASKKEMYMHLERFCISKNGFSLASSNSNEKWCSFNEMISAIEENYKKDNFINDTKEYYDRYMSTNYNTFDEYLNALEEENNVGTLDELIDTKKNSQIASITKFFDAKKTFRYEINERKMALTEKFTGIKNTLDGFGSSCEYKDDTISLYICYDYASLSFSDNPKLRKSLSHYYDGYFVASSTNEILFINHNDKNNSIIATYKEDLENEAVIVTMDGKEYKCDFYGNKFIQE